MQTYGHQFQFFDKTINTAVTKSHRFVKQWLQLLIRVIHESKKTVRNPLIVGLGIEIVDGGVATIQLCYANNCLIYHVSGEESFPPSLAKFLLNPKCVFFGFSLKLQQLERLRRETGFDYLQYRCLFVFAKLYIDKEDKDLSLLIKAVLENLDVVRPRPGSRRWDLEDLSVNQIEYASIGAYVSHHIGKLLWRVKWGYSPNRTVFIKNQVVDAIEQVHEVQIFDKTIITTVTNRLIAVENWISDVIRDRHLYNYVGFDLQLYTYENEYEIATVQFCVDTRCLVIYFAELNGRYLPMLEHFLVRDNNTFVGVDIEWKMGALKDNLLFEYGGQLKIIDLDIYAANTLGRPDFENASQDTLVTELFEANLERPPDVEYDWFSPFLSDEQVQGACINAAASYEIGKRLLSRP